MEDILNLLNINITYNERKKELEEYVNKKISYKILNLSVASTSLNFSKTIFSITPLGIIDGKRNNKDGVVLFGYEPNKNTEEDIVEQNDAQYISVYDFVFPIEKENSLNLKEFPSFAIYFNTKDENYYIKDFNIGIGALMKIKKYKIENNTLINIGANYLVICIEEENLVIKIFNNCILKNKAEDKKYETKNFKINKKKMQALLSGEVKNVICLLRI